MKLEKIMVVDDSEADQFLTKITIENFKDDIEVEQAYDGKEALELIERTDKQPDLIILDINMPVMNGHEFLEAYDTSSNCGAVIVMLTSSEQPKDRELTEKYSCVSNYCIKPFTAEDLHTISLL